LRLDQKGNRPQRIATETEDDTAQDQRRRPPGKQGFAFGCHRRSSMSQSFQVSITSSTIPQRVSIKAMKITTTRTNAPSRDKMNRGRPSQALSRFQGIRNSQNRASKVPTT